MRQLYQGVLIMRKLALILLLTLLLIIIGGAVTPVFSAVGCTLNNPDGDIKKLFPDSTSYKTTFIQIDQKGGRAIYNKLQKLLGDKLDNVYETMDVPYAYYQVFSENRLIGYVHGVNQKGKYGGMQIIIATDPDGKIKQWYYQKLSSPEASRFKNETFRKRFRGLSLADFFKHDYFKTSDKYKGKDRVGNIDDPSKQSHDDFLNTLRGMRKNLILLDQYWLERRYEPYWHRSQKLLSK